MRILFLTHSFNSLAQRLYLELSALGHVVSVELDIADAVTIEAVALCQPALVIAPFLKRAIPEAVWRHHVCLVVHPGIVGDRGPSALDWALSEGERDWGVTVLQADAEMDAGPVWATETFQMRQASKSSLYRNEVTDAAVRATLAAVARFAAGAGPLQFGADVSVDAGVDAGADAGAGKRRGRWRPLMRQADRRIDWLSDDTATVLRKIRAADGAPGVLDSLFGIPCHLFDAHAQALPALSAPGLLLGRRDHAVLRATSDGAIWIGHVRRADVPDGFKLPTALAFPAEVAALPDWPIGAEAVDDPAAWREIRLEARDGVATLHFDFYNGAMSTAQCQRLGVALRQALALPERVLVLAGGADFWSNGLHLNVIEAADSPADASWRNIQAMNDLTQQLIQASDRLVIAAMQGNAGAGGVFMAQAADRVWARGGIVLNPHYKNMGNLHGSEYWTYLLPRRLTSGSVADVMDHRLPMSATQAVALGLVDGVVDADARGFLAEVHSRAAALAASRPSAWRANATRQPSRCPLTARPNWRACTATSTASTRATTSHGRTSCAGYGRPGHPATWRCTASPYRLPWRQTDRR
jgi:putative two-component system hydrogenase maturation factor HypX/HoxX